ncbi:MAG: primosomal protein N' [Actinomycetota bacterium]|nr:primosomal protein N' [Actinomycetota bacterium]
MAKDTEWNEAEGTEQLALVPSAISPRQAPQAKTPKTVKPVELATALPVARVAVDVPHSHLDRLFDYSVPATLDESAVPGCRVKVRFAGKLVDGFLTERVASSDHTGKLGLIAKVVSPEPVLRSDVLAAARLVADRYAGTLADVLRLAIPPRHARTEAAQASAETSALAEVDVSVWASYDRGAGLLSALSSGNSPRTCWSALPGDDPAVCLAQAVLATLHSGRGAVVLVPDIRDVARFDETFRSVLGEGNHVVLHASQGPAERYKSFLALLRGEVKAVVGTRAAAFAPVDSLGLVAIWDDGDDLFAEQRSPYPHAREILLTRALDRDAGVLIGGHARSVEAQQLVESGWCREIAPSQSGRREAWPRIEVTDGSVAGGAPARLPGAVFTAIRQSKGPVLIQVPRRGYRAVLACQDCRARAECGLCHGPLAQTSAGSAPVCGWCGTSVESWECSHCHGHRLRAPVVGALRTAEEIGKAFADVPVITSGGTSVLDTVPAERSIVLATPGAEPRVDGGYDVVVLLDTWLMLGRQELRVEEEAHRRWFNALAMAGRGGRGVIVGDPAQLQALVRTDPVGFAHRELASRAEAHMPPVARIATVESEPDVIAALGDADWPPDTEVLGPVPIAARAGDARERLILRIPRRGGAALAERLKEQQAKRSAAKLPPLRAQIDPLTF